MRIKRAAAAYAGCAMVSAVVAAPLAAEVAVEGARFEDRLGTLPVEVSLLHNGYSALDTGIFGTVFWKQTGGFGFGVSARVSGPPEAGGTLASYADSRFIRANAALIEEPGVVVEAYTTKFRAALRDRFLLLELLATVLGGAVLMALVPWSRLAGLPATRVGAVAALLVVAGFTLAAATAAAWFGEWSGNRPVTSKYLMPGVDRLSFSSAQTLEVAIQVEPFISKNTERLRSEAQRYEAAAEASFATALGRRGDELVPRGGEVVVVAEADPQGSRVGARVRTELHRQLAAALGADAIAVRTISGDVTSNGTVAEASFVELEASVGGDVPTVAVGGDHDSETTWAQLDGAGVELVDLGTTEVGGLRVSGAHDREHKTLFGGLVTNSSGISEEELGRQLRESVAEEAQVVLLHQPAAAAGFLRLESLAAVRALDRSSTRPREDGIPDQVPGTLSIGHLHELDGPWVLWNTDGPTVTWTLVDQLGTSGGVENHPTFNRFSTPGSAPLKPITLRLHYVAAESGLATGYATVTCDQRGECSVSERSDVGLPGGEPLLVTAQRALARSARSAVLDRSPRSRGKSQDGDLGGEELARVRVVLLLRRRGHQQRPQRRTHEGAAGGGQRADLDHLDPLTARSVAPDLAGGVDRDPEVALAVHAEPVGDVVAEVEAGVPRPDVTGHGVVVAGPDPAGAAVGGVEDAAVR